MSLEAASYPREWLERIRAPFGKILVERDENPTRVGKLWLPDTFRTAIKRPLATIFRSSCPEWEEGMRIILAHGIAQRLDFGETDPTVLYLVTPRTILAILHESIEVSELPGPARSSTRLDPNLFYIRADIADQGASTTRHGA